MNKLLKKIPVILFMILLAVMFKNFKAHYDQNKVIFEYNLSVIKASSARDCKDD